MKDRVKDSNDQVKYEYKLPIPAANSSPGNLKYIPHLQRVLPPSQPIKRENLLYVNPEKLKEIVSVQFDPRHPNFRNNLSKFMQVMEKIRGAVQSNLGLSAIERDAHETNQPIWIMKGKPPFPIEKNGQIKTENIVYNSIELKSLMPKQTPKVLIIDDISNKQTTNNDGISLLYKTKFREFSLHIASDGKVTSSLNLNWEKIYDDLSPDVKGQQQPLRSFTPWQRHSESNFFNGRSTDKILTYLAAAFPNVFSYDSKNYFRDVLSESLHLNKINMGELKTNNPNVYVTLDASLIKPAKDCKMSSNQPILAVVRRKSPLMGNLIQLVPAIYADEKLHLVLHGHQKETEIQEVFSCDFETEKLHSWEWQQANPVLLKTEELKHESTSKWSNLHLLKHHPLIKHTAAAPMVRGSDAVMRQYWVGSFDIPSVYTEMITIADIFNVSQEKNQTPQDILEKFYYSDEATSSFRRMMFSEYELKQAEKVSVQMVVPHESTNEVFFWGHDGENIARTTRMAVQVLFKMVPPDYHHKLRLAVNMCCPAASIEKMGAGFGLRNRPDYIERIVQAVKQRYPWLDIVFKTLMLSNADQFKSPCSVDVKENGMCQIDRPNKDITHEHMHKISVVNNKNVSEALSAMGADGLVWQGKSRNEELYHLKTSLDISKASKVNPHFKFGFSGMIAALKDSDLVKLGYKESDGVHYSVEGVLKHSSANHEKMLTSNFEVMLGRVLLGSSWLLLGRYASDQEILLMTLLQCFLLREFAVGAGPCGIDLMQIQILYNARHLANENLRNTLMDKITETRSSSQMLQAVYQGCASVTQVKDMGEDTLLKPSILRLKNAIDSASGSDYKLYSDRENRILQNQLAKSVKVHMQEKSHITIHSMKKQSIFLQSNRLNKSNGITHEDQDISNDEMANSAFGQGCNVAKSLKARRG